MNPLISDLIDTHRDQHDSPLFLSLSSLDATAGDGTITDIINYSKSRGIECVTFSNLDILDLRFPVRSKDGEIEYSYRNFFYNDSVPRVLVIDHLPIEARIALNDNPYLRGAVIFVDDRYAFPVRCFHHGT